MDEQLQLAVQLAIDKAKSEANLKQEIQKIKTEALKVGVELDDKTIKQSLKEQQKLQEQISKTVQKRSNLSRTNEIKQAQAINKALEQEYAQTLKSNAAQKALQQTATNAKYLNSIDFEITKREQAAKAFSSQIQAQMQARVEQEKYAESQTLVATNAQIGANRVRTFNNQLKPDAQKQYAARVQELSDAFAQVAKTGDSQALKNANANLAQFRTEMQAAGNVGATVFQKLQRNIYQFFSFLGAATISMTVINSIRSVISTISDLDAAITDLRMATGDSYEDVSNLMNDYIDLAKEMSSTPLEVAASASDWLKQGQSIADTNTLIKDSLILSKVGSIDSASATTYLTAAMKAYGLAADEVLSIVDKLSAVDMASATDVAGLAEGLSNVAASAEQAGVSIDKLLGYLATIGETTQESLSEVGTSLNAIFARMGNIKLSRLVDYESGEDLSNVETVLSGLGIKLRNSNSEFRDFGDVLDEVASKWSSYSSVSQRAISNAFAGTQHTEEFIVLMQNYNNALEYTEVAADSAGTSTEKFSAYADSLDAKLNELTATLTNLKTGFLESDTLKNVISSVDTLASGASTLIEKFGLFPTVIGTISASLALFNKSVIGFKTVTNEQTGVSTTSLTLFGKTIDELKKKYQVTATAGRATFGALTKSITLATVKTVALTAASVALNAALTMGISAVITGIISLFQKMANSADEAKEAEEEMLDSTSERIEEYSSEQSTLNDLIGQYTNIVTSTNSLASSKTELLAVQKQLIALYGEEAENLDLVNDSYAENIKKINEQTKANAQKIVNNTSTSSSANKYEQINDYANKIHYLTDEYNKAQEELDKANAMHDDGKGTKSDTIQAALDNRKAISEQIEELKSVAYRGLKDDISFSKDFTDKIKEIASKYNLSYEYDYDTFNDDTVKLAGSVDEQINAWAELLEAYKNDAEYNDEDAKKIEHEIELLEQYKDAYEAVSDAKQSIKSMDLASDEDYYKLDKIEKLKDSILSDSISISDTTSSVDDINKLKSELYSTFSNNSDIVDQLDFFFEKIDNALNDANITLNDSISTLKATVDTLIDDTFNTTSDSVEKFNNAITTLVSGDALDFSTVNDLISLNGDLTESFSSTAEGYVISLDTIQEARDEYISTFSDTVQQNLNEITFVLDELNEEYDYVQQWLANNVMATTKGYGGSKAYSDMSARAAELAESIAQAKDQQTRLNLASTAFNSILEDTADAYDEVTISAEDYYDYEISQVEDIIEKLEEKQELIENQIEQYESAQNAVVSYIDTEIDKLQEENDTRQTSIDLQKKEAALADARRNKIMVYTSAQGWHSETDTESVSEAENDLKQAQIDAQIDKLESYRDQWNNIAETITDEQDLINAKLILGADWQEKIAEQDQSILDDFADNYEELQNQSDSIQEQVDMWKEYKEEFTDVMDDLENSNADYIESLDNVVINEQSSYETRLANLQAFKEKAAELNAADSESDSSSSDSDSNKTWAVYDGSDISSEYYSSKADATAKMNALIESEMDEYESGMTGQLYATQRIEAYRKRLQNKYSVKQYSQGGIVDYDGVAIVHGKRAAEMTLNNSDVSKVYDLIHNTDNLAKLVAENLSNSFGTNITNSVTNGGSSTVSISIGKVVSNNASDFVSQLNGMFNQMNVKLQLE